MSRLSTLAAALLVASRLGAQTAAGMPPSVPVQVRAEFARPPLADGDGALLVLVGRDSIAVAVGTAVADSTNAASVCTVARLRAERELVRQLVGLHIDSRSVFRTFERRGAPPTDQFDEIITERVAGQLARAALGAQWWADGPRRCRVGLWLVVRSAPP